MICNAIPSSLSDEFLCCSLGVLSNDERAKSDESLVSIWFGFPFVDGGVIIARAFHGGLEESKAMMRSAGMPAFLSCCSILSSRSNLVAGFLVGFQALSMVLMSSCMSTSPKVELLERRWFSSSMGVR